MRTIDEMIAVLKHHPGVKGLVRYGSTHDACKHRTGDYELFVVLGQRDPLVSSLHFFAGGLPVDLNLITLKEVRHLGRGGSFERSALLDGEVLYDPTGQLEPELDRLRRQEQRSLTVELSDHEVARIRHGHRHVFDKVKGRLDTKSLFCRYLLGANVHWLVESYFRVRCLAFSGEKRAIENLQTREPEIYAALAGLYATSDLKKQVKIQQALTQRILAPIGGPWRGDKVLAFGDESARDLQKEGRQVFRGLFGGAYNTGERV